MWNLLGVLQLIWTVLKLLWGTTKFLVRERLVVIAWCAALTLVWGLFSVVSAGCVFLSARLNLDPVAVGWLLMVLASVGAAVCFGRATAFAWQHRFTSDCPIC